MCTDDPYGVIKKLTSSLWLAQTDFWHPHQGWTRLHLKVSLRVWLDWKQRQNFRSKVRMDSCYNSGVQLLSSVLGILCKSWSITFRALREPGPNPTLTWTIFCISPSSPIKTHRFEIQSNISVDLTKLSIVRPAAGSFHAEYVQSRFISYFDNYFMHHGRLLSRDARGLRSAGAGRSVKFVVGVGGECLSMLFF